MTPDARLPVPLRRVTATLLDALLGGGLAVALSQTPVGVYFATRAVVMLQIGHPASIWKGPIPMILGAFGELVYTLPFALCAVMGVEALTGRSPGKLALGLRILPVDDDRSRGLTADPPSDRAPDRSGDPTGRRSALIARTALKLLPLWGCVLGLVTGLWHLAVLGGIGGGVLLASILVSRPLHERGSRTRLMG